MTVHYSQCIQDGFSSCH